MEEQRYIEVKFKVQLRDRLTPAFVQKQVTNIGETILDAFDETIHDVSITDLKTGEELYDVNLFRAYP